MSELLDKLVDTIRSSVYESDDVADHMHEGAAIRAAHGVLGWMRPEILRLLRTATVNMPTDIAEAILDADPAFSGAVVATAVDRRRGDC